MASFYCTIWWLLLTVYVTRAVSPAIPNPNHKARVVDRPLSEKSHFDDDHNVEFDHDAFLGNEDAKEFDELSPEESKQRLGQLFLKIDNDSDGIISEDEMHQWMRHIKRKNIRSESEQQWKEFNPANNKFVSWEEYERHSYGNSDDEETDIIRDKRRWTEADVDNNSLLSFEEFVNFVHPEEAEHLKDLIIQETLEDVDTNHDGFISFEEYMNDAIGEDDDEDEDDEDDKDGWIKEEEQEFQTHLDQNGDGILDNEEIVNWVVPDDFDHINEEVKHLFSEADQDKDGFLNAEEVIDNYDLFVGSQATDYGDIFKKDEL